MTMDLKRWIRWQTLVLIIALLLAICLSYLLFGLVVKDENTSGISATMMIFPPGSNNSSIINNSFVKNNSYIVWAKTVKTTNGLSFLKSEDYNLMAVCFIYGYWTEHAHLQPEGLWEMHIEVAGAGATRSNFGFLRGNGLKRIVLKVNHSNDVESGSILGFGSPGNFDSDMLSNAINSSNDEVWPFDSSDIINASIRHAPFFRPGSSEQNNRTIHTLMRWDYTDWLNDGNDAVFALETTLLCHPGQTQDISYVSEFSWGPLDHNENEISLRFIVPPSPVDMSQEQLRQYNITGGPSTGFSYEIFQPYCVVN